MKARNGGFKVFGTRSTLSADPVTGNSGSGIADRVVSDMNELITPGNIGGHSLSELEKISLGKAKVKEFGYGDPWGGEIHVEIEENIRGLDAYLVSQFYSPGILPFAVNEIELYAWIDALHRAEAAAVYVVHPFFPYSRQDYKKNREPISLRAYIDRARNEGVNGFITFDPHQKQLDAIVDKFAKLVTLDAPVISSEIMREFYDKPHKTSVISPDAGGLARAKALGRRLGAYHFLCDKNRNPETGEVEDIYFIGDRRKAKRRHLILTDDIIASGDTYCQAIDLLQKELDPKSIQGWASHFEGKSSADERLSQMHRDRKINYVHTTDSVAHTPDFYARNKDWLAPWSIAPLFAQAILRDYVGASIQALNNSRGVKYFKQLDSYN